MKDIIQNIYINGIEKIHSLLKDPFTRRAAKNRCKRCKRYGFHKMYWSCLECEFCCHLINFYLYEKQGEGVIVGKIDKEISNVFARHFKKQIQHAKKDTKVPSESYFTSGVALSETGIVRKIEEGISLNRE